MRSKQCGKVNDKHYSWFELTRVSAYVDKLYDVCILLEIYHI